MKVGDSVVVIRNFPTILAGMTGVVGGFSQRDEQVIPTVWVVWDAGGMWWVPRSILAVLPRPVQSSQGEQAPRESDAGPAAPAEVRRAGASSG